VFVPDKPGYKPKTLQKKTKKKKKKKKKVLKCELEGRTLKKE
jgi:hypothetical protein